MDYRVTGTDARARFSHTYDQDGEDVLAHGSDTLGITPLKAARPAPDVIKVGPTGAGFVIAVEIDGDVYQMVITGDDENGRVEFIGPDGVVAFAAGGGEHRG